MASPAACTLALSPHRFDYVYYIVASPEMYSKYDDTQKYMPAIVNEDRYFCSSDIRAVVASRNCGQMQ